MRKTIMSRIVSASLLSAIGLLFGVNVSATTARGPASADMSYHWKYVANDVYHCTSDGALNCDTESAHSWEKKE